VIDMPSPGAARSFWLQEALADEPGEPAPPLERHLVADVCIVGGGFAGLWTAIQLTEREPGLRIALIEQDIAGGGASGRNGGFLSASWFDIDAIIGLFGDEEGLRYGRVQAAAIDAVGSFATANGIDCWFHKDGTMGVRSGEWQGRFGDDLGVFQRLGITDRVELLSAEQTRARADSPRFLDGTFFEDGAVCQPARLARGLRRVALERGVHLFERTRMTGLDRPWCAPSTGRSRRKRWW